MVNELGSCNGNWEITHPITNNNNNHVQHEENSTPQALHDRCKLSLISRGNSVCRARENLHSNECFRQKELIQGIIKLKKRDLHRQNTSSDLVHSDNTRKRKKNRTKKNVIYNNIRTWTTCWIKYKMNSAYVKLWNAPKSWILWKQRIPISETSKMKRSTWKKTSTVKSEHVSLLEWTETTCRRNWTW